MADTVAAPIKECIGWKLTDDEKTVVLGFRQPDGDEFALAMDEGALKKAILALLDATGAFQKAKMQSGKRLSISTNWFELGRTADANSLVLSFRLSSGGELSFLFPRDMASRLKDALQATLEPASMVTPPDKARN